MNTHIKHIKSYFLVTCIFSSIIAGCEVQVPNPLERISIQVAQPDSRIEGTYKAGNKLFRFVSYALSTTRSVRFERADGVPFAVVDYDINTKQSAFMINGVQWINLNDLTISDKNLLRSFGASSESRVVLDVAAYLYSVLPAPQFRRLRVLFIELYREIAEFFPRESKTLQRIVADESCMLSNVCGFWSDDAIFNCFTGDKTEDVIPLLDGLPRGCESGLTEASEQIRHPESHQQNECYGACGSGCSTCSIRLAGCYESDVDVPFGAINTVLMVKTAAHFPLNDLPPVSLSPFYSCTAAECCLSHDECNRHDTLLDWLSCQKKGATACGIGALSGEPRAGGFEKWFNSLGFPVEYLGYCNWKVICDGSSNCSREYVSYDFPAVISHADEQRECPVHNCKHPGTSSTCVGVESDAGASDDASSSVSDGGVDMGISDMDMGISDMDMGSSDVDMGGSDMDMGGSDVDMRRGCVIEVAYRNNVSDLTTSSRPVMNDNAQIADALYDETGERQLAIWEDRQWRFVLKESYIGVGGINNQGHIIGDIIYRDLPGQVFPFAFLWRNGQLTEILKSTTGGRLSYPNAINDGDTVLVSEGFCYSGTRFVNGYWSAGTYTELEDSAAIWSDTIPVDINNNGTIVGDYMPQSSGCGLNASSRHAWLYRHGAHVLLSPLGSSATAINNPEQVVGAIEDRAVIWSAAGMPSLLPGSGQESALPLDINDPGQIVGVLHPDATGRGRAVLWENERMIDLNTDPRFYRPGESLIYYRADTINNRGYMLVRGRYSTDDVMMIRHFLLIPPDAPPGACP